MSCTHKTWTDHTTGVRTPDGRNTWICSHCGAIGVWTESWSYYGNLECLKCQTASMEWVACSRECAIALNGGRVPRESPISEDRKAAAYDRLVAEGKVQT